MRTVHQLVPIVVLALTGCAFEPGGPGDDLTPDPGTGPGATDVDAGAVAPDPDAPVLLPNVVCLVDRTKLGVPGLTVRTGLLASAPIVTFVSWQADPDHPDRHVGFTLSSEAAAMHYVVRAGDRDLDGQGVTFTIPPGGGGGPRGGEISRVEFCDD